MSSRRSHRVVLNHEDYLAYCVYQKLPKSVRAVIRRFVYECDRVRAWAAS
jgi:hypothetical protein